VVDTCPPRLLCDRAFIYDAAVVMIPGIGDPLIAHVFGHMGEPLSVERWKGPLPEHVAALIP
jgi:hypothetical protein